MLLFPVLQIPAYFLNAGPSTTCPVSAMTAPMLYDVLIVGGGPAGLAAASGLARQLYTNVVFDSGVYRNSRAQHMHNVLGFDHVPPEEYRAKARADLVARYNTTTFATTEVKTIVKTAQGLFKVSSADGRGWYGRKVILATGVMDLPPEDIAGFGDCFGRGIFHCLFCHGYEERGVDRIGIFALGQMGAVQMAMHVAFMAKPLGKKITIYTHGNQALADEIAASASSFGFVVESSKITGVRMSGKAHEVIITLADGTEITEGFVVRATIPT
jgi:gliotoxin/aspirochlorine biosynthesis thioredoxin reductase